jgi:hypothetical protein
MEPHSGELHKPALDLIDPGHRSRREVDMIMRPAGKPRLDLRRLVGGIVIHDDMDIELFGTSASVGRAAFLYGPFMSDC